MRVLAFVPDLMDRSRLRAPGAEVVFVSDPSELVGAEADLVVLDLSRPGVVEALPGITALTVGFSSHVDEATIRAAADAGCDEVCTRSVFFRRFPELVGSDGRAGG